MGRQIDPPRWVDRGTPLDAAVQQLARQFRLTVRQRQVAKLIALGLSNREIAEDLGIAYFTVKEHARALYCRLDVVSRAQVSLRLLEISSRTDAALGPQAEEPRTDEEERQ